MSFFSLVGLIPLDFKEGNHGQKESEVYGEFEITNDVIVEVELGSQQPSELHVDTDTCHNPSINSPATAKPELHFGLNTFTSAKIIIAKGFIAEININQQDVVNLFMIRPRAEPLRVAQIMADEFLNFRMSSKIISKKDNVVRLYSGVHEIVRTDSDSEIEFYFLSQTIF